MHRFRSSDPPGGVGTEDGLGQDAGYAPEDHYLRGRGCQSRRTPDSIIGAVRPVGRSPGPLFETTVRDKEEHYAIPF